MFRKRTPNLNAIFDKRHALPGAIKGPIEAMQSKKFLGIFSYKQVALDMYRCTMPGCGYLNTQWELRRYGRCQRCRGQQFVGNWPINLIEHLRFQFWSLLQNWRVHGKAGWGWK